MSPAPTLSARADEVTDRILRRLKGIADFHVAMAKAHALEQRLLLDLLSKHLGRPGESEEG